MISNINARKRGSEQNKISVVLLPFALLFLIFLLPKTYCFGKDEQLLEILDFVEWPLYIMLFIFGIINAKYKVKQIIPIILVMFIFMITYWKTGYAEPVKAVMLIVGMKNMNCKKLISTMYYTLSFSIILTLALYMFGISDAGEQRRSATSLGYIQANTVGFVLMFWTFLAVLRKNKLYIKDKAILFGINLIGYLLSDSRTGFFVVCLALVCMDEKIYGFIKKYDSLKLILSLMPVLCCAFVLITAYIYPVSRVAQLLDRLFTNRVWLNYYSLTHFDVTLFGQRLSLWTYGSYYNPVTEVWHSSVTVDCVYVMLLLNLGIISTMTIFYAYRRVVMKLCDGEAYVWVMVLTFMCLYGLTESSVLSIYVFFPFLTFLNEKFVKKNDRCKLG